VEVRGREGQRSVGLHLTPLDASPILESTLFATEHPVVLTSATMTVGNRFDFMCDRLGISNLVDREVIKEVFQSPFSLADQMVLAVPEGIPEPGREGYVASLANAVGELVCAAGGGSLVLFTSYRTLDSVHEACLEQMEEAGLAVLRQGEAPRTALLEKFRADPESVLFATDSFWEGVDVVGSSLKCVIIARLPFPVPSDPVNEARGEAMAREGRDPFMEDSVPRAVIKFRQGVGRLIRHRQDTGFAVICDVRVVRRAYGSIFLESLGEIPLERAATGRMAEMMKTFFQTTDN
jgi:ATP-dependent DNA helicase DinG